MRPFRTIDQEESATGAADEALETGTLDSTGTVVPLTPKPGDGVAGETTVAKMTVIQPSHGLGSFNFGELWEYRELLFFLTWRDIKVRYKQSVLGIAWAVIQPVTAMIIFSIVFGQLAKLPSEGVPYPVFSYVALLPWMLFSNGLTRSTSSVVGNLNLIKKVYVPRLLIPVAGVISPLADFAVAFIVLVGLMLYFGLVPPLQVLVLPAVVVFTLITSLGVGLWLSALNTRFRDVQHAVPFLVQIWLFASPVAYTSSLVPERWSIVFAINPMVGVIEAFRWAVLGSSNASLPILGMSGCMTLVFLISGILYFRQSEKIFADVV